MLPRQTNQGRRPPIPAGDGVSPAYQRSYLSEMPEDAVEQVPIPTGSPQVTRARRSRAFSYQEQLLGVEMSAVVMVLIINFMDSLGGNISTPILAFYGREFGASNVQVGQLFAIFAFAQTTAMPLLSYISDRAGRRRVLLLSLAGGALGALWQGLATSYASLFAARAFSGVWAGVSSVCQVYIVDVVRPEWRVEYLGYLLSSTQASTLFGPSIGAGLSALGLSVPVLVQAAVSAVLVPSALRSLPESPAWIRAGENAASVPTPPVFVRDGRKPRRPAKPHNPGIGRWGTCVAVAIYGVVALCSMMTQMSVVSMFAVFAKESYGLNSLRVGFCMTLGAVASIGTNIYLSPPIQRRLGNKWASIVGSLFMMVGSLCTYLVPPLPVTLASLMITYLGMAINAGAVATGTANLTDMQNRSTVMTGVRMLKSLGAMLGPLVSGYFAGSNVRLPFVVAAVFAFLGGSWQLVTIGLHGRLKILLEGRKTVGLESALLETEGWKDEYGTPEEIRDLGEYVANLLTTRHYRWVTYNEALKNCLSDFLPELPVQSEEDYKKAYDYVRGVSRALEVPQDLRNCDDRLMMMT